MSQTDFERSDRDVDMTIFRWENHKNGKIPFDHENNTLRGLEESIQEKEAIERASNRSQHMKNILEEYNRQKFAGHTQIAWDALRQKAAETSRTSLEYAQGLAQQDAAEAERIRQGLESIASHGYSFRESDPNASRQGGAHTRSRKKSSMKKSKKQGSGGGGKGFFGALFGHKKKTG